MSIRNLLAMRDRLRAEELKAKRRLIWTLWLASVIGIVLQNILLLWLRSRDG